MAFDKWWLVTLSAAAAAALYGVTKVFSGPAVSAAPGASPFAPAPPNGLRQSVLDGWFAYSVAHEGFTPYPYCDTLNLVTSGIGNLIDAGPNHGGASSVERARLNNVVSPAAMAPALLLPWKSRAPGWTSKNPLAGNLVSQAAVIDAWTKVKNQNVVVPDFSQRGGGAYAGLTAITLDMDGIKQLFGGKTSSVAKDLCKTYPAFPTWPSDAQQATMSMSWAMGSAFYPVDGFALFKKAVDARNWQTAAIQCQFNGGGSLSDKTSRNAQNALMFNNAAAVEKAGSDPNKLWFPLQAPVANV